MRNYIQGQQGRKTANALHMDIPEPEPPERVSSSFLNPEQFPLARSAPEGPHLQGCRISVYRLAGSVDTTVWTGTVDSGGTRPEHEISLIRIVLFSSNIRSVIRQAHNLL